MKYTPEQIAKFLTAEVPSRGTPWPKFKADRLNELFNASHVGKNASVSQILAETVRHGEREPHGA